MAAAAPGPRTGGRLRRPLLLLAAILAALLLTALFAAVSFPYERFREPVETRLAAQLGMPAELGGLEGRLTPFGPSLLLRNLRIRMPQGGHFEASELQVRPAWSPAWLRGIPALHLRIASPLGSARGVLYLDAEPAFRGRVRDLRLAALPPGAVPAGLSLDGTADLEGLVRRTASGPEGRVRIEAREGSIGVPGVPVALPFESLRGVVGLGHGRLLEIVEPLVFEGPMVSGSVTGSVADAPRIAAARLDLRAELVLREPGLAPALAAAGIRTDREGRASVRITGTPSRVGIR